MAPKANTEIKYYPKKSKSPIKAIRLFCFECMGWDRRYKDSGKPYEDVRTCPDTMCPLFDFRFGRNPFTNRTASPKAIETMRKYHLNASLKESN